MSTANISSPHSLGSAIHELRGKWGWIVALGVVYVVAGFIALGSVVMATVVSAIVVGVMMVFAGVVEVISAFQMKSWGRFFVWILLGALYTIAGLFVIDDPLFAAGVLTLIIGAALVACGIVRIFLAFQMQSSAPWVMVAISGVITALLGAIILWHWPVSGFYVLGTLLGVDLIFAGVSWVSIGLALRKHA
jgi:uncharacterized membrane protein HdeD (DUF308 family)